MSNACRSFTPRACASRRPKVALAVALALIGLTACASTGRSLSVDVDASLTPRSVATYTIEVEQMPGFLVPYFRDELVAALAARGATEVAANGDVEFVLRFAQLPLGSAVDRPDALGEASGAVDASRFLARVELVAKVPGAGTAERIGTLSRAHSVTPGAYMHERARGQIRRGFDKLLAAFVAPRQP